MLAEVEVMFTEEYKWNNRTTWQPRFFIKETKTNFDLTFSHCTKSNKRKRHIKQEAISLDAGDTEDDVDATNAHLLDNDITHKNYFEMHCDTFLRFLRK